MLIPLMFFFSSADKLILNLIGRLSPCRHHTQAAGGRDGSFDDQHKFNGVRASVRRGPPTAGAAVQCGAGGRTAH